MLRSPHPRKGSITAAFGALQLFFDAGLMVGPPYIDAISAAGVMTIMFVLSIDYEVFLLTRIREAGWPPATTSWRSRRGWPARPE